MAYTIEYKDGYVEVNVAGHTSKLEVIEILRKLNRRDPHKEIPDLWIVQPESQIPLADFVVVAQAVGQMMPFGTRGAKSALVAMDQFQKAEMEMYRGESAFLPFELRVFFTRAEALEWLQSAESTSAAK